MTKKEQKDRITKHVISAIQKNFYVTEDFHDDEGRGYFTFGVTQDGIEYRFDMSRRDFSIISYKVRNEKYYTESIELENKLEKFIKHEIGILNDLSL